jgi:PAS domain-containing protein
MNNPFSSRSAMSIRHRFYILFAIILGSICILEASIFYSWYQARQDQELKSNLELARAVAKTFQTWSHNLIGELLLAGQAFSALPNDSVAERNRLLQTIHANIRAARSVAWMSLEGKVISSTVGSNIGHDLKDRSYFSEVSKGREWFISELLIGRTTGKPTFVVSRGIRSENGELLGVIAAAIEPEFFEEIFKGIRTSKSAGVGLIDSKGMLVYRYPMVDFTWEERNWFKIYPLISEVLQGREVTATVPGIRPNPGMRVSAAAPISDIGWAITCSRLEKELNSTVVSSLFPQILITVFLTVLAIAAAIWFSRPITQSVIKIAEHVDKIGRGELVKMDIDGPSELKVLSDTLNGMADRIRSRETDLRESEEQFRVLTQNLVSGVALINERGEISIVNKAFLRLFDLAEDTDILNTNSRDWGEWQVFDESGRLLDVDEHPVRKAVRTHAAVRNMLVAMQCPGRSDRKWMLIPFRFQDDSNYGMVMAWPDHEKSTKNW